MIKPNHKPSPANDGTGHHRRAGDPAVQPQLPAFKRPVGRSQVPTGNRLAG